MSDPIKRQTATDALPSAQPESTRTFVELVVRHPNPELCAYKEYKGKPYYSIKYIENGETYVGYGTYNPEVLSQYLKEYFISSSQPEIVRCKDCKHRDPEDKKCDCGHDILWQLPRQNDWYCADAERRTDETRRSD